MRTRVLVVDDDEISRSMVEYALLSEDYHIVMAEDGQEALSILSDPDRFCRIVISDWEMPGLTGLELCRRVRAESFQGYVYFILLTHRDRSADVVTGLQNGADDFVSKPFDPTELKARVEVGRRIVALETRDLVLFALARLAEHRDTMSGAHLERLQHYVRILCKQLIESRSFPMELGYQLSHLIYLSCPLHDIGNIAIPDNILLKPGKLTPEEYDVIKKHTTYGAATLNAAIEKYPEVDFLHVARDIVLYHHERYDGTGYPKGLAGEQIPLAARIVSVVDVYDVIRSHRVYKSSSSHEEAVACLQQGRGRQFDPMVVDAFLGVQERIRAVDRREKT